jgi:hypothetical protein
MVPPLRLFLRILLVDWVIPFLLPSCLFNVGIKGGFYDGYGQGCKEGNNWQISAS